MTSIGLWEIAVLALLRERPMHPYEMQRLLKERHTEDLLPLKRGSLYHAIDRLVKSGLIEAVETTREGNRPQRTTYRLADGGEAEFLGHEVGIFAAGDSDCADADVPAGTTGSSPDIGDAHPPAGPVEVCPEWNGSRCEST